MNSLHPTSTDNPDSLANAAGRGDAAQVAHFLTSPVPLAQIRDALRAAAKKGYLDAVKVLVAADPQAGVALAVRHAAENGQLAVVKSMVEKDPTVDPSFALTWAARRGHLAVVAFLISLPRTDPTTNNSAALRWAAEAGHLNVVKVLVPVSDIPRAAVEMVDFGNWSALDRLGQIVDRTRRQAWLDLYGEHLPLSMSKQQALSRQQAAVGGVLTSRRPPRARC